MNRRTLARYLAVVTGGLMLAAAVFGVVPAALADAAPFAVQEARLTAVDGAHEAHFGTTVAIDGDTLVVTAIDADAAGVANAGTAYVYVKTGTTWAFQQQLFAPAPAEWDKFGASAAIEGDRIVIGAPNYHTAHGSTGAAFVFTRTGTTWSAADTLPTELVQDGDRIGQAVAIDGDLIILGCPGTDDARGELRPIEWTGSGWDSGGGMTITDPYGEPGDRLGSSVALSGDIVLSGATGDDEGGLMDAGTVVSFTRTGGVWGFFQKWGSFRPAENQQFGGALDISESGYTCIVGVPMFSDGDEGEIGRAFVYERGTPYWNLWYELPNPEANSPDGDWFGSSVALDGDSLALVGAFWDDSHTGAAYYFETTGYSWGFAQKIDMTSAVPGVALFGDSVALDNGTAVVGAPLASAGVEGVLPGAVFVFSSRGTITGVVRDGITGEPIEGVEMSAYVLDRFGEPDLARGTSLVFTDALGRYTMSLDTGSYLVGWMHHVYPAGFYPGAKLWTDAIPVGVTAGETTTLDLDLYMAKAKNQTFYHSANRFHSAVQRARLIQGR